MLKDNDVWDVEESTVDPIEDLGDKIETHIGAMDVNLQNAINPIKFWLFLIFILGLVALYHFW